jgi:hypothetical protein
MPGRARPLLLDELGGLGAGEDEEAAGGGEEDGTPLLRADGDGCVLPSRTRVACAQLRAHTHTRSYARLPRR